MTDIDESVKWTMHFHYVCPECSHETCPDDPPTAGAHLTAAQAHAGEEHPDQWGPEPGLKERGDCSAL